MPLPGGPSEACAMLADFHFLTPAWFLALLPLGLLLSVLSRRGGATGAWRRVVDERLLAALTVGADGSVRRWPLVLLGVGWLGAVLALADPTFERMQVPAVRDAAARVVALDLSRSMLAEDLVPTRVERARFKVEDILRRSADGQVGLVAFAGDAFSVVPLTDDAETVRGMLPALSPDVMPAQGSRSDLAIIEALKLLRQAGAQQGEVVLLTDDPGGARARSAAAELRRAGFRLGVIGVGTPDGAPVPGVRTSRGAVIARLEEGALRSLARHGGGDYARITVDDADLRQVLDEGLRGGVRADDDPREVEVWKELGPWLALALVPFAALGFRRGWLLMPAMLALNLVAGIPAPLMAAEAADAAAAGQTDAADGGLARHWRDLWQRRDQQAAGALADGDYQRAVELAEDPARAGAARYRLGDFEAAADAFAERDGAGDHYNRGNALARAGALEDALSAYDEALARDPAMDDARHNRAQVEEALRRRQQQQEQQQQQQSEQGTGDQDEGQSGQQSGGQQSADQQSNDADGGDEQATGDPGGEQSGAGQDQPSGGDGEQADPSQQADTEPEHGAGDPADQSDQQEVAADGARDGQDADTAATPDAGAGAGGDDETGQDGESAQATAARQAREEQAAADYRDAAAAADAGPDGDADGRGAGTADQTDSEAADAEPAPADLERRQAADQWLRRIPDDPAGLLRRKFMYQYRARAGAGGPAENPW
jgi:Ca-activated chloride channel family protein